MRIRRCVLTAVLSSILVAGCYSLNPSEYVGPDGAASNDTPSIQGGDVAQMDVPMGGMGGGGASGGLGGSSGDAGVPDAPGVQPDAPMGGSIEGAGGIGGVAGTGGDAGGTTAVGGTGGGGTSRGLGGNGDGSSATPCEMTACLENWAEWPIPNSPADVDAGAPNLESYTDNLDGTVTDDVTGLMWQQVVPDTQYTWEQAVTGCPTLTLAGHSDWRLPSLIELYSIVDAGQSNPSIDSTYFPKTPVDWYWSSSPQAGSTVNVWSVFFGIGSTYYFNAAWPPRAYRCVRSTSVDASASAGRYVVTSDGTANGTVYDTKTRLTWQQTVSSATYSWAEAKAYCGSAAVGGSLGGTGWRLPTIKELMTIVDLSQATGGAMIDPNAFPQTQSMAFWSSSPLAGTGNAWSVYFGYGSTNLGDVSIAYPVRCVR